MTMSSITVVPTRFEVTFRRTTKRVSQKDFDMQRTARLIDRYMIRLARQRFDGAGIGISSLHVSGEFLPAEKLYRLRFSADACEWPGQQPGWVARVPSAWHGVRVPSVRHGVTP